MEVRSKLMNMFRGSILNIWAGFFLGIGIALGMALVNK